MVYAFFQYANIVHTQVAGHCEFRFIHKHVNMHKHTKMVALSRKDRLPLFFFFVFFYYLQSVDIVGVSAPLTSWNTHPPAADLTFPSRVPTFRQTLGLAHSDNSLSIKTPLFNNNTPTFAPSPNRGRGDCVRLQKLPPEATTHTLMKAKAARKFLRMKNNKGGLSNGSISTFALSREMSRTHTI